MVHLIQNRFTQFTTATMLLATSIGIYGGSANAQIECQGTIGSVEVSSVIVPDGETCILDGTEVQGDVTIKSGATLVASGARVEGNIQGQGSESVTLEADTFVTGQVQLETGNSITIVQTVVNNDLQLQGNDGAVEITDNSIGGNLQAKDNDGGIKISSNDIGNNLQCQDNDPSPTGGNNTANQKEGQCEDL